MTAIHASADMPGRPALHLTARSGWVNDPHKLTYHADRYHLFARDTQARSQRR